MTGLVGTYLVVVEVLLMGRVPWLDRMIGMDRLAIWHRRNGEYSICLLVAHAVLTIWGYAVTAHEGLVNETDIGRPSLPRHARGHRRASACWWSSASCRPGPCGAG